MDTAKSALLREPKFFRLFVARTISVLGSAIAPVALAFAILEIPGGTASDLGLVVGAYTLSRVIFLLFGGVFADRLGKIRLMIWADYVAAAAQAGIAALILLGSPNLAWIIALSAISGAASGFFLPASSGIVADLVEASQLQKANSLLRLSTNAAMIIGAASAGALVAFLGSGYALLIDGASFFVSALFLIGLHVERPAQTSSSSLLGDLQHGWSEFVSRQWTWVIVLQFSIVNACFNSSFGILGPLLAKTHFGGPVGWSAITASQSVGMVLGTFVSARLRSRFPLRLATYVSFLTAVPLLTMALKLPVALIAISAAIQGIGITVFTVLWDTALQTHIPKETLGRVYAYDWLGSLALIPVAQAIVGPVAATLGNSQTLYASLCLILIAGLAALCSPSVRQLRPAEQRL